MNWIQRTPANGSFGRRQFTGGILIAVSLAALTATRFLLDRHVLSVYFQPSEQRDVAIRILQEEKEGRLLEESDPQLTWCLSYPQFGIVEFLDALHKSSGFATATNYGEVMYDQDGVLVTEQFDSVPVYPNRPNGPYKLTHHLPLPPSTILTRSHCAGLCMDCSPRDYVPPLTRFDSFLSGCTTSTRYSTATDEVIKSHYYHALVKDILWVMRNPFDIIVARFKHERAQRDADGDEEFADRYDDSPEGFQTWCSDGDYSPTRLVSESMWYDVTEFAYAVRVPCRAEFYKWIHWQNQVLKVAKQLNLRYKVVHYEDLKYSLVDQMRDIHQFLGLDFDENRVEPFETDESYVSDYYDDKQRDFAERFVQKAAQPEVFEEVKRYFE